MKRRRFLQGACATAAWMAAGGTVGEAAEGAATRRIVYLYGPLREAAVEELGASGFNVVILAFLYVDRAQGRLRLRYNASPVARVAGEMGAAARRFQRGFGERRRVLVSIGGWGNRGVFEAIRAAGVEHFLDQYDREVGGPMGIDGLDLDLEPGHVRENTAAGWHAVHDDLGATLVELTNAYRRRHPDGIVTHAPIASVAAALYVRDGGVRGVRGSLLEATRRGGGNNVSWLNVQCYEAGDPKPVPLADYYREQLVDPLRARGAVSGVGAAERFLIPGFEPRYHQTLEVCESDLRAMGRAVGGGIGGAFLWQYGQIAGAAAAWSAGLEAALAVGG